MQLATVKIAWPRRFNFKPSVVSQGIFTKSSVRDVSDDFADNTLHYFIFVIWLHICFSNWKPHSEICLFHR